MKSLLRWCALVGLVLRVAVCGAAANDRWFANTASDTVIVFVHGIFSDSTECWTSKSGAYWPALVRDDARLKHPAIYLGGYATSADSGLFGVYDAADQLRNYLTTPTSTGEVPPLSRKNILFIAHSTGGLVVRQMLVNHPELFHDKTVGLLLVASPSRGSEWANRLKWLAEYYGNHMAIDLQRNNEAMNTLDRQFADLVSSHEKIPRLVGKDLFETKFIVPARYYKLIFHDEQFVVSATDSASYFGGYQVIPDSDHFSIVKPTSPDDPIEIILAKFYLEQFLPLAETAAAVSSWGLEPSSTGRKLYHAQIAPFANASANEQRDFNHVWAQGITTRINSVLTSTLLDAPQEFQFEGTDIVSSVEPANLEMLAKAGHALNGVAVASTLVQAHGSGAQESYLTETTFRAMYTPRGGEMLSLPNISGSVPAGENFGPISVQRALSKTWGYYVVLSLAARCLADEPHVKCDRQKMITMLAEANKTLGPTDKVVAREFSRLIELARAGKP